VLTKVAAVGTSAQWHISRSLRGISSCSSRSKKASSKHN